jgi:poly(glycerol-phosphate) alpha-glucosyltransferase
MLTNEAAADFKKKYGFSENLYTIAHPYPFEIKRSDFDGRDHKKAVVVSRLSPEKRLGEAIDIMAEVIKHVPDACLDIYGFGSEEKVLKKKIESLSLGENIKVLPYTNEAAAVMSRSACFLMTSSVEGLGLTLIECISNGCPAFAYDIKYGPGHLIKNNVTGFLFERNDKRKFAKALIKYFQDTDAQRRMSENCYDDAEKRFTVEEFLRQYSVMVETMYRKIGGKGDDIEEI